MSRLWWCSFFLSACNDGITGPSGNGPNDVGPNDDGPSITLLAPVAGEESCGEFEVAWEVDAFRLGVDGHVQVVVDGEPLAETDALSYTVDALAAGAHTIEVRLRDLEYVAVGASDSASVAVLAPRISLGHPATVPMGSYVELPVSIVDFTLAEGPGGAPVCGTGHYLITVDGVPWDWGNDAALVPVSRLTPGLHAIQVELVGNDGASFPTPAVSDVVNVEVPVSGPYVAFDHAPFAIVWESAAVPLSLNVENFELDGAPADTGGGGAATGGYTHFYMDGAWGESSAVTARTINHLSGGWHRFDVVLVDGASGWELPVRDVLRVHVAEDRPDIRITTPGDRYGVHPDFNLSIAPENFTLSATAIGGTNVADQGHFSVSVDGGPPLYTAAATTAITGLTEGEHAVRVQLVNNDGTPVVPPVYDEIVVVVDGSLP